MRSCFNCCHLEPLFDEKIKSVGVLCRRDYFVVASTRQAAFEALFTLADACADFDLIKSQGMTQRVLAMRWLL